MRSTSFRSPRDYLTDIGGWARRTLGSLVTRRQLYQPDSDGDRVSAVGRESRDPDADDDARQEVDEMDMFSPVGFIGRPKDEQTVELLILLLGGDSRHPVAAGALDKTRRDIIAQVGLEADTSIHFTSALMVKLRAGEEILAGSLAGPHKALGYHEDDEALDARITALEDKVNEHISKFLSHVHVSATAGSPSSTPVTPPSTPVTITLAATSATLTGTGKLKAD